MYVFFKIIILYYILLKYKDCNLFSALEVIGEQEKVLQDTRDFFDKTVAYFAIETTVRIFTWRNEENVRYQINSLNISQDKWFITTTLSLRIFYAGLL